jgi:hypothetical protein
MPAVVEATKAKHIQLEEDRRACSSSWGTSALPPTRRAHRDMKARVARMHDRQTTGISRSNIAVPHSFGSSRHRTARHIVAMHHYLPILLQIAIVYLIALVSPGPNFFMITQLSLAGRRGLGAASALGVGTGSTIWASLAMLGFATVLQQID